MEIVKGIDGFDPSDDSDEPLNGAENLFIFDLVSLRCNLNNFKGKESNFRWKYSESNGTGLDSSLIFGETDLKFICLDGSVGKGGLRDDNK